MKQVRLIFVGGFLGAGKTTLIKTAALMLSNSGLRVGVMTNDQADSLVDTGIISGQGLPVEEIAGGCFCCRFDDLVSATERLLDRVKPDILMGEPVGSCTDISATVLQPMKQLYSDWFRLAPFTVLADPARLAGFLDGSARSRLPESVLYIYSKQLEEADIIALNKCDAAAPGESERLRSELAARYPAAAVIEMSALEGKGVDEWLAMVTAASGGGARITEVDYDTYADGEALLGWLNASIRLDYQGAVQWRSYLEGLLGELARRLDAEGAEIAHLKMLLNSASGSLVANLTGGGAAPFFQGEIGDSAGEALLVLNIRAHIAPGPLRRIVEDVLGRRSAQGPSAEVVSIQSFSPSRPNPVYRYDDVV